MRSLTIASTHATNINTTFNLLYRDLSLVGSLHLILTMEDASRPLIELRSSPPPSLAPHPAPRRKRTRASYHEDESTPSDGPLFSSDPPDPSVDLYIQPRRKRQYRGTWWGEVAQDSLAEPAQQRSKSGFSRNMDSGIWMGSDNTEGSFGSDNTVPDEELPQQVARTPAVPFSRILPPPEPPSIKKARAIIQDCLDNSKEDVCLP